MYIYIYTCTEEATKVLTEWYEHKIYREKKILSESWNAEFIKIPELSYTKIWNSLTETIFA